MGPSIVHTHESGKACRHSRRAHRVCGGPRLELIALDEVSESSWVHMTGPREVRLEVSPSGRVRMHRLARVGGSSLASAGPHVAVLLDLNPATMGKWVELGVKRNRSANQTFGSAPQASASCGGGRFLCCDLDGFMYARSVSTCAPAGRHAQIDRCRRRCQHPCPPESIATGVVGEYSREVVATAAMRARIRSVVGMFGKRAGIALAACAAALLASGVSQAQATGGFDSGSKGCRTGEDVVVKGDSGPGQQGHSQKTATGTAKGQFFPSKNYRHGEYSNYGFTNVSLWSVQIDPGYLYMSETYAYCLA